jgi:hypothetical protein
MMEALGSSETSLLTRATRGNIPEDTIFHSHRSENLKSYLFKKNDILYVPQTYIPPQPVTGILLLSVGISSVFAITASE